MSPTRRILSGAGLSMLAATVAVTAASAAAVKPVIGQPVAKPATPIAGKAFSVSYRVTRSDTGKPLTKGRMICDPSSAGKVIPHTESFKRGLARLSFVVPASAKLLTVKVAIKAGAQSATRVSTFKVTATALPTLSIADASVTEGNSGIATLSFPVTLSAKSTDTVSVAYATSDGTATTPADYTAASGTLSFAPGETAKTIAVSVVSDLSIEPDETLSVTLSNPLKATITKGTAAGAIMNDDTAVPVMAGNYKGATQNGDYVFLTARPDRMVTGFRANDVTEHCGGAKVYGRVDWTENVFRIRDDGSFAAEGSWTGSQVQGDIEWTSWYAKLTGIFNGPSVTGTILIKDELNYGGRHYVCSSGELTWAATLQG